MSALFGTGVAGTFSQAATGHLQFCAVVSE